MKELDTFTVERLEEIIAEEGYSALRTPKNDEVRALARIALSAKQAVPIYQYQSGICNDQFDGFDWVWDDCDKGFYGQYAADRRRIVYTVPQLNSLEIPEGWKIGKFGYQDLFNAIGAAVSSPHAGGFSISHARCRATTASYQIDQIKLMNAISTELNRQVPNIPADHRFNVIAGAASMIVEAYRQGAVPAPLNKGLKAWLASDDTGSSSLFMAAILSGGLLNAINHYPRDPDDLGRCIRLIKAVPEFKGLIHRMCDHGKEWSVVAKNWDRWSELYEVDDDELYAAMSKAYHAPNGE